MTPLRCLILMPFLAMFLGVYLSMAHAAWKNAAPRPVGIWMQVPVCESEGNYACVLERAYANHWNSLHATREQYARKE